jgi:LPPG:FO 2-phospho-L-lactate transferase
VILLAPSNPWVSLDPILAVPGIRQALRSKLVIGVSPIVGGRALKGPAAKMAAELRLPVSAETVAAHFLPVLSGFVIDTTDADQAAAIEQRGLRMLVTNTVMRDGECRAALAAEMLALAKGFASGSRAA